MASFVSIPELTPRQIESFHASYTREACGCWEWNRAQSANGYGSVSFGRALRSVGAHRVAYFLHHGVQPGELCVCHSCDNPICVNPDHLWLGTKGDNNRDMDAKGRRRAGPHIGGDHPWLRPHNIGSANPNAKLTEDVVLRIRASDLTNDALAAELGMSAHTIRDVRRGRSWAHVAPPQPWHHTAKAQAILTRIDPAHITVHQSRDAIRADSFYLAVDERTDKALTDIRNAAVTKALGYSFEEAKDNAARKAWLDAWGPSVAEVLAERFGNPNRWGPNISREVAEYNWRLGAEASKVRAA